MMIFKTPAKQAKELWEKEKKSSHHINIIGHYDDTTLIDKDGKLIKLFKLDGIDATTQETIQLDILKNRRNSFWKAINYEFAVYTWTIRSKTADFPGGEFNQAYAKELNACYQAKIEHTELFHNQLYLALITKPPEGKINKTMSWFKRFNQKFDSKAREREIKKALEGLNQLTQRLLSTMQPYGVQLLGTIERHNEPFSEALGLMGELINGNKFPMPLLTMDAPALLCRTRSFFNHRTGTLELRYPDGSKRYAAAITIKEYANFSIAGLLDELQSLAWEFTLTQSYRFYDRQTSKTLLKEQQSDMEQTQDAAMSQTEELTDAIDETASGEIGYGTHHLTLLCFADKIEQLNQVVADMTAVLSKLDIVSIREDLLIECAYWAQLPGNFAYTPRTAPISTKNFASFASFHNATLGKINGNFWGHAVTVLETLQSTPYYFNYHYRDVGNTLIFGAMGAGKTVLMGFLLAQLTKFGGKWIVFDKDRGLEILVRALGGTYDILKPGIPTGFNPCLLGDTAENRTFLAELFKKMLTIHSPEWDEADGEIVQKVVERLYTLPQEDRQLCHIAPYFGTKKKGSLRARFDEWHSEGSRAWLFDNNKDSLNLNADVLGFELGHILKEKETKTPACMYLVHRINQALEGRRGAIIADEGWNLLDDDYFKAEINNWGRTPRKKNRFLCLATQSADDAVKTSVSDALSESAACKIFFPNPAAKRETYIAKLGLSEREYELIKTLNDDRRFFLLNYGKGAESVVVRLDLTGLEDLVAVISGRETSVLLLDHIRAEFGDDPIIWLPLFKDIMKHLDALRQAVGDVPAQWLTYYLEHRSTL